MTGTSTSLKGDNIDDGNAEYSKYEYTTHTKQRITYTFKPMAIPAFARALDAAVCEAIGDDPGRYTVKIDKPVKRSNRHSLYAYLTITRPGELASLDVCVPGWRYDAGESE